jgi:hypothetical protein
MPVAPPRGLTRAGLLRFAALATAGFGGGAALASCAAPEQQRVLYGGPPDYMIIEDVRQALDLADAHAHAGDTGQFDAPSDAPNDAGDGG